MIKQLVPWKQYLIITTESLVSFYLATFSVAMFFTHEGSTWLKTSVLLILLYLFVIAVCIKRIISALPTAALMLIIPLAPLIAITIVISLIPLLQLINSVPH